MSDLIYDCAKKYRQMANYEYKMIIFDKDKNISTVNFAIGENHFFHASGLQHLDDLDDVQNKKAKNISIRDILSKNPTITDNLLKTSSHYDDNLSSIATENVTIEDRFRTLMNLKEALDELSKSNSHLYLWNSFNPPHNLKINAKYFINYPKNNQYNGFFFDGNSEFNIVSTVSSINTDYSKYGRGTSLIECEILYMERIHKKNNIILHQDILINTPIDIRIDREQIAKRNQQLADVGNVLDELRSLRKAYLKKPKRASANKYLNMVDKILRYGKDILEIAFKRLGDEFKDKNKVNQRELIQLERKSFSEGKNFLREDDRFKFDIKNISVQDGNIAILSNLSVIEKFIRKFRSVVQLTIDKIKNMLFILNISKLANENLLAQEKTYKKNTTIANKVDNNIDEQTQTQKSLEDVLKQYYSKDKEITPIEKQVSKKEIYTPIGQKIAKPIHNEHKQENSTSKDVNKPKKTTKL